MLSFSPCHLSLAMRSVYASRQNTHTPLRWGAGVFSPLCFSFSFCSFSAKYKRRKEGTYTGTLAYLKQTTKNSGSLVGSLHMFIVQGSNAFTFSVADFPPFCSLVGRLLSIPVSALKKTVVAAGRNAVVWTSVCLYDLIRGCFAWVQLNGYLLSILALVHSPG